MAFVALDGVLGIEGIHRWNNSIDLNTQSSFPRIEIDSIVGLHGLGEADDVRGALSGRMGEIVYPSLPRGRTITYTGRVVATGTQSLRNTSASLRAKFSDRSNEGTMVVRPITSIGGSQHQFKARVLSLDMDDEQTFSPDTLPTAYQRQFVLSLRQSDPRFQVVSDPILAIPTGGEASTFDYHGTAPADPWMEFPGPTTSDLICEKTVPYHRQLLFPDLAIPDGVVLTIDFRTRRATYDEAGDFEDVTAKLDFVNSDWWNEGEPGLDPGVSNVIRMSAVGHFGDDWSMHWYDMNW